MGTVITLKRTVFKKDNRISANLETLGPLELKKTHVIPSIVMEYCELPVKEIPN